MKADNFIYFSTVSGFFIGLIFSILKDFSADLFLINVFIITLIFYIISLGSASFFIKFVDLKKQIALNKTEIDQVLDVQIKELEKKENFILENYEFIKQIEQEELEFIKKMKG